MPVDEWGVWCIEYDAVTKTAKIVERKTEFSLGRWDNFTCLDKKDCVKVETDVQ